MVRILPILFGGKGVVVLANYAPLILLMLFMLFSRASISNEALPSQPEKCPLQASDSIPSQTPQALERNLLVFVSLSMPKKSLQQWAAQATKVGGVLVFRGFKNNSLKETIGTLKEVLGEQYTNGVLIDPTLFQRFEIKSVPAVVVSEKAAPPCTQEHCQIPAHDILYGDVGLSYALKKMRDDGQFSIISQGYLNRLGPA
jgi:type-F conjugative transfer system pilin assembly protein TrbC